MVYFDVAKERAAPCRPKIALLLNLSYFDVVLAKVGLAPYIYTLIACRQRAPLSRSVVNQIGTHARKKQKLSFSWWALLAFYVSSIIMYEDNENAKNFHQALLVPHVVAPSLERGPTFLPMLSFSVPSSSAQTRHDLVCIAAKMETVRINNSDNKRRQSFKLAFFGRSTWCSTPPYIRSSHQYCVLKVDPRRSNNNNDQDKLFRRQCRAIPLWWEEKESKSMNWLFLFFFHSIIPSSLLLIYSGDIGYTKGEEGSSRLSANAVTAGCLGVQNKGNNETVKTQDFSENENQDLRAQTYLGESNVQLRNKRDLPCQRTFWVAVQWHGHQRRQWYQ